MKTSLVIIGSVPSTLGPLPFSSLEVETFRQNKGNKWRLCLIQRINSDIALLCFSELVPGRANIRTGIIGPRDITGLCGSYKSYEIGMAEDESTGELLPHLRVSRRSRKMKRVADLCDCVSVSASTRSLQVTDGSMPCEGPANDGIVEKASPAMVFLPSHPTEQELGNIAAATGRGFALTGSATMGKVGKIVGPMDIGECDDSYMFRVSLPGVKRDESEFSCEVSNDGKVSIRGVTTTGETTVNRFSQKFEMLSQNLCPPGHFSISFQLPGPVNPEQFSGSFGTDGILEGIVMKKRDP